LDPSRSARTLHRENRRGIAALSADGNWAVTGARRDDDVQIWNLGAPNGPTTTTLRGDASYVSHAVFTPDSKRLITADGNGTIRIWSHSDAPPYEAKVLADGSDPIRCLAIDDQGRRLVAGHEKGTVTLISLPNDGSVVPATEVSAHNAAVTAVFVGRGGNRIWTGAADGIAKMWRLSDDNVAAEVVSLEHDLPIRSIVAGPSEKWVAICYSNKMIRLWDLTREDPGVAPIELSGSVAAFDPSGRWLVGDNQLWDLANARPFTTPVVLRGHDDDITCLAVGAQGRLLATGSKDATVRIRAFRLEPLLDQARRAAGRDFTDKEKGRYITPPAPTGADELDSNGSSQR